MILEWVFQVEVITGHLDGQVHINIGEQRCNIKRDKNLIRGQGLACDEICKLARVSYAGAGPDHQW